MVQRRVLDETQSQMASYLRHFPYLLRISTYGPFILRLSDAIMQLVQHVPTFVKYVFNIYLMRSLIMVLTLLLPFGLQVGTRLRY